MGTKSLICFVGYAALAAAIMGIPPGGVEYAVAALGAMMLGWYCAKLDVEGR